MRWMAPEIINPTNQAARLAKNNPSRDVYAFGCTILEVSDLSILLNREDKSGLDFNTATTLS